MKISVILTSYNHEKYIKESIESILQQSYKDFELIIIDDCSNDSSWNIICDYKKLYPEIVIIRHEKNWGTGNVEDVVLNYAQGKYIALHHSDDIWEFDKLERQVRFLENNPEYVAVFTNAQAIDDDGDDYSDEDGFYYDLFTVKNRSRQEWLNYFFYKGNCLCHPSILIRKDVYMENGFFKKGLKQIPDFVKWIQICKKHEIYVLPERLVKFRVHAEGKNTSGMRADTQIRSTLEWYWMLEEYKQITDKEEFIKVFPEAKEFCEGKEFVPEYALGKICTRFGVQPYTRLFGDTLLYTALNDPHKAKVIKEQYNYTVKDFTKETGKYDIFGVLPVEFEQERTLYVDFGDGWDCQNCIIEKYILNDFEKFKMKGYFDVPKDTKHIKFRFDPAERVMVRVELSGVYINGESVPCIGENAFKTMDASDIFINLDPIYSFALPDDFSYTETIEVMVSGTVYRLSSDEVGAVVTSDMYEKRDVIYEYEFRNRELSMHAHELENDLEEKNKELNETNNELSQTRRELDAIKSTIAYKAAKKVYSLFKR